MGKKGDTTNAQSFGLMLKLAVCFAILAAAVVYSGVHIPSFIISGLLQVKTGLHGYFGLGLLIHESLSPVPISSYVKLGYWTSLKLKFIYVSRKWGENNFMYQDWLDSIHAEILEDFERRGVPKDEQSVYQIPTFDVKDIDPQTFFKEYVRMGRPVIIRNFFDMPAMSWTPEDIKAKAGDFVTTTRCMDGSTRNWTVAEYIDSKNDTTHAPCYLDNNANIFEKRPELYKDLQMWRFAEYMTGKKVPEGGKPLEYIFSQLFLSVFNTTGALFHCANYNNLFFMIQGRKKWTFVDPSNSFLMYPMFNGMFKDSKSFLSWTTLHANNTDDRINKSFPLYRYVPKYTQVLERGDILLNPPWNWHMVENMDEESIGVATRWMLSGVWPYTNGLFSFLQMTSWNMTEMLYQRMADNAGVGEFKYRPTSHQTLDDQVNFGKYGSLYPYYNKYLKNMLIPAQWNKYLAYLEKEGYFKDHPKTHDTD